MNALVRHWLVYSYEPTRTWCAKKPGARDAQNVMNQPTHAWRPVHDEQLRHNKHLENEDQYHKDKIQRQWTKEKEHETHPVFIYDLFFRYNNYANNENGTYLEQTLIYMT